MVVVTVLVDSSCYVKLLSNGIGCLDFYTTKLSKFLQGHPVLEMVFNINMQIINFYW